MSRTYRKNKRWFRKFKGEFLDIYWRRETYFKKNSCNYRQVGDNEDYPWGASGFDKIVWVTDSDNWHVAPSCIKRIYRRMDRARYKQALLNDEDTNIISAFDSDAWD